MVLVAPSTHVAAPARTPLPFGLGSVLGWRLGDRWASGVQWMSITCDPAGGRGGPECDPDEMVGLPKEFTGERSIGLATPFIVYGHDVCSIFGNSPQEAQDFANAHLIAREEARAEQALWTGDLGNVPNFAGANGYPAPIALGTFSDAVAALGAVEHAIAQEYGSLGVIHMTRQMATLLGKHLEKRGGRLFTRALDTPVVAGGGYPVQGRIIGTPALFGYRGDIITSSNRPGDLLDRGTNQMYAVAEREYVIGFDPCPIVEAIFVPEVPDVEEPPDPDEPLTILLGSIPSSPIPDGSDATIIAQTNVTPTDEVYLWYSVNGGADVLAGEMTQVDPHEFVWQVIGDNSTTGDSVEVWALTTYGGSPVESNHITIEVT